MLAIAVIIFVCHSLPTIVNTYYVQITLIGILGAWHQGYVYIKKEQGRTNKDRTRHNKLRDHAANRKARAHIFGDGEWIF